MPFDNIYGELKDHVEATKNHVVELNKFKQPDKLTILLPIPRVEGIQECLRSLEKKNQKREDVCEAAWDLADRLSCEAERQRRGLQRVSRLVEKAVHDPDVCGPQFEDIDGECKRRQIMVDRLLRTGAVFERIAAECEEPPEAPPAPKKPAKIEVDVLDRARGEIMRAASDKERALRRHDTKDPQNKKKKGDLNEYNANIRKAIEDAKNIAQVGSAEAQLSIAGALRELASNPVGSATRPLRVQMRRADHSDTPDGPFWLYIRGASTALEYENYARFMDDILCAEPTAADLEPDSTRSRVTTTRPLRLPFPDTDAYRFLKTATEVFMMMNCGVWTNGIGPTAEELAHADRRLGIAFTADQVLTNWRRYRVPSGPPGRGERIIPYLALIRQKLGDSAIVDWSRGEHFNEALAACSGIVRDRLESPCMLELIWSYWHEEGMLVQTMNAISRRFQNIRTPGDRDPLAMIEIDPLRPLNNFLWGYIQDEQHRLTVVRRAYEYDHHYGLSLVGRAVPGVKGADSRKRFLEAFHQLLHLCTIFFKEDDDTTVIADGFPILNALREVHIILSQGAHNQYGDLPWTARQEMLMQEWLLSRGETREFLPSRIMVAYPEPWMDRVDAMKQLMGWTDTSVMHFRELGIFGERILLGARFNDWTRVIEPERAANWARFWRPEINSYIHAYRAATGVDLAERADATMPSMLLRSRLAAQRIVAR